MGVLPCARKGCYQIMCDRYSRNHGYICYECFEELVKLGKNADIDQFLISEKPSEIIDQSRERWEDEFRVR